MTAARRGALAWLAVAATACTCPDRTAVVSAAFEHCDAELCGFVAEGSGTAGRVATILPGEHGLELRGEVVARLSVAVVLQAGAAPRLELVASCAPAALQAELVVDGVAVPVTLEAEPADAHLAYRRLSAAIPARDGQSITRLDLHLASGTCVLDEIELTVTAGPCDG